MVWCIIYAGHRTVTAACLVVFVCVRAHARARIFVCVKGKKKKESPDMGKPTDKAYFREGKRMARLG